MTGDDVRAAVCESERFVIRFSGGAHNGLTLPFIINPEPLTLEKTTYRTER